MRTVRVSYRIEVPSPAVAAEVHSTWQSPLPYIFGGLAAIFVLISASMLFLALSYWKYTARLERAEREQRDLEAGGQTSSGEAVVKVSCGEKVAVIMAGDENPTCLATPRCYRGFGYSESDEEECGRPTSYDGKDRQSANPAAH